MLSVPLDSLQLWKFSCHDDSNEYTQTHVHDKKISIKYP